ncbi:MAG TPA: hypothetical protein VME92_01880 [Acetobacteraceae bacterium]|nr:hypothetical protein [Acetobacteraceae bacterium]
MRILLAGMSSLLVGIVTAVFAQMPDAVVAGSVGEGEDLASRVRRTGSDVVVMQVQHPGNAAEFEALLRQFPALRVIAIAARGNDGFLHELRLHTEKLPDLSLVSLRDAIRRPTA